MLCGTVQLWQWCHLCVIYDKCLLLQCMWLMQPLSGAIQFVMDQLQIDLVYRLVGQMLGSLMSDSQWPVGLVIGLQFNNKIITNSSSLYSFWLSTRIITDYSINTLWIIWQYSQQNYKSPGWITWDCRPDEVLYWIIHDLWADCSNTWAIESGIHWFAWSHHEILWKMKIVLVMINASYRY